MGRSQTPAETESKRPLSRRERRLQRKSPSRLIISSPYSPKKEIQEGSWGDRLKQKKSPNGQSKSSPSFYARKGSEGSKRIWGSNPHERKKARNVSHEAGKRQHEMGPQIFRRKRGCRRELFQSNLLIISKATKTPAMGLVLQKNWVACLTNPRLHQKKTLK